MQLYNKAAGQQAAYAQNANAFGLTPEQLKYYGQNSMNMELLNYYQQQHHAQQYQQMMQQMQKHAQYPPTSVSSGNRKSQSSTDMLQVC